MGQQASLNIGDIIFQFVTFGVLVAIVSLIFWLVRNKLTSRNETNELKRKLTSIESKVDHLLSEKEKHE